MFYSPSTGGFYVSEIHSTMPGDVVQISNATHAQLMADQSAGKRIQPGANGQPVAVVPVAAPAAIPPSITMRQARLALLNAGLLGAVNAGISGMSEAEQIEWEFAATVDRASPLVATLAPALGLDSAALDALFTAGAVL